LIYYILLSPLFLLIFVSFVESSGNLETLLASSLNIWMKKVL
jgi:hypothetical protein